jgi:hypothetical protein
MANRPAFQYVRDLVARVAGHAGPPAPLLAEMRAAAAPRSPGGPPCFTGEFAGAARSAGWAEATLAASPVAITNSSALVARNNVRTSVDFDVLVCEIWRADSQVSGIPDASYEGRCGLMLEWTRHRHSTRWTVDQYCSHAPVGQFMERSRRFRRFGMRLGLIRETAGVCPRQEDVRSLVAAAVCGCGEFPQLAAELRPRHESAAMLDYVPRAAPPAPAPPAPAHDMAQDRVYDLLSYRRFDSNRGRATARVAIRYVRSGRHDGFGPLTVYMFMGINRAVRACDAAFVIENAESADDIRAVARRFPIPAVISTSTPTLLRIAAAGRLRATTAPRPPPILVPDPFDSVEMIGLLEQITDRPPDEWPFGAEAQLLALHDKYLKAARHCAHYHAEWRDQFVHLGDLADKAGRLLLIAARIRRTFDPYTFG